MRKRVKGRKFGRTRDKRRALMRHLVEALVKYEQIETTEARAKELRPFIERWITKSRKNTLAVRRDLLRYFNEATTKKMLDEIAPRFTKRPGGYTRIIKRGRRLRDASPRAMIEFVQK